MDQPDASLCGINILVAVPGYFSKNGLGIIVCAAWILVMVYRQKIGVYYQAGLGIDSLGNLHFDTVTRIFISWVIESCWFFQAMLANGLISGITPLRAKQTMAIFPDF